jgi:hypothetical protein
MIKVTRGTTKKNEKTVPSSPKDKYVYGLQRELNKKRKRNDAFAERKEFLN